MPVATSPKGADALALILALWSSDPALHDQLSQEILDGKLAFDAVAIRESLTRPIDPSHMAKAEARVQANGRLFQAAETQLAVKGLPQLWFPDAASAGRAASKAFYFDLLAQHLDIRREAEPRIIIEQTDIALGSMPMNATHRHELRFTNPGESTLEISGADLPEQWRLATPVPLHVAARGTSKLLLDIVSPPEPGEWKASVTLRTNVIKDQRTVVFSGNAGAPLARARPAVRVTPLRVVLPPRPSAEAQNYSISMTPDEAGSHLRPEVELPAELKSIGVTSSLMPPDARNAVEITLHFPAGFDVTRFTGSRVVLRTGDPRSPDFQLPMEAAGQRFRPGLVSQLTR